MSQVTPPEERESEIYEKKTDGCNISYKHEFSLLLVKNSK